MKSIIKILLMGLLMGSFSTLGAQTLLKDSVMAVWMISPHYSYQIPLGDMADRFGGNSALGGSIGFKNSKNWLFGVEGSFLFSNNVKELGQLVPISLGSNVLIRSDGRLESAFLVERGFTIQGYFGKVIPLKKPNVNSGILVKLGMGMLQHKIRLIGDKEYLPQISGNYLHGYDRLTSGVLLTPFIGYQYMSLKKRFNAFAGIEFNAGFTKGRRYWNFDTNSSAQDRRTDMLIGFKGGIIIARYVKHTDKYYYY